MNAACARNDPASVRAEVRAHLAGSGGRDQFDDGADLVRVGVVNSLQVLDLIEFVAEHFRIDVQARDVYAGHFSSLERIAAFVLERGARP
jgi:hypothetical protein